MNDAFYDFIAKTKETAKKAGDVVTNVANRAAQKTGELVEIGKINFRIAELNGKVTKLYEEIGETIYKAALNIDTESSSVEEKIEEITALKLEIAELKNKVDKSEKEGCCPNCGNVCGEDAVYCPHCGKQVKG